jgi:hypothetical protein
MTSMTQPTHLSPLLEPFAEVVESHLDHFVAQCWQWDTFPTFGSLVQVHNGPLTLLGTVTQIQTGSMDPIRYPFPYQKSEQELMREQPQIFEFLKTTFTVQILGYVDREAINQVDYLIPPTPSKIHAFVSSCPPDLIKSFFSRAEFLHLLFGCGQAISNLDELLLVMIKNLHTQKLLHPNFIEEFSLNYSMLTGSDYRRLKLFMSRVQRLSCNLSLST